MFSPQVIEYYLNDKEIKPGAVAKTRAALDAASWVEKIGQNTYRCKRGAFSTNDYFVVIDVASFEAILALKRGVREGVFWHFVCVLRSLNWNIKINNEGGVVGMMPVVHFAKQEGVTEMTISRYNKILEDLSILYFVRYKYNPKQKERHTNIYGLHKNMAKISMYAASHGETVYNNPKINYRAVAMKYTCFIKNPVTEDITSLIADCREYNKVHPGKEKNIRILELCNNTKNISLRKYYIMIGGEIKYSKKELMQIKQDLSGCDIEKKEQVMHAIDMVMVDAS